MIVVGLTLPACGAQWQRQEIAGPVAPEQQVQVWRGGSGEVWHGVRLDSQLVSGIPYHRPRTCDECRLAIPRREVDSLRVGSMTRGFRNSVLFAFAVMAAVALTFRDAGGN